MLETAVIVILALLLDRIFGEPARFHPLIGFGRWANWIEKSCNTPSSPYRWKGALALLLALLPVLLTALLLLQLPYAQQWLSLLLLYLAIGARSLDEHVAAVSTALHNDEIDRARLRVSYIVSRDTQQLNHTQIASAATESALENGSDAIFAAIFWFWLAGPLGVLLYRMANTLDAMWGYKNHRFLHFGWAAARFDDLLNWIPARLCALTYCLCGHFDNGFKSWRAQAPSWKSPNAGPVMAAGAGAINTRLGGAAPYHGQMQSRPALGIGAAASADSIDAARALLQRGIILWALLPLLLIYMSQFL
ncbi:adenosylcobinamide-phosphate synthase CbiB [Marinobacterium jannaschii]|uniref:adenosylcobinamide-phosphate synthase CbiB n=1 Tax=Marinobacterium jannaschii TaxID=64970 RepID=UPI0004899ECD|nr:adenosylcobinamide-phosphate synthase CbiB [Marinobacterium jannaschii]